jgi:short-subunit dehydrogenase involved in D-alanine esterification of teichoic acids
MNELINTVVVTGGALGLDQALVSKQSAIGVYVIVLDRHDQWENHLSRWWL